MTTVVTTKNAVRELVPVVRERLADLETPVSAFAKLRPLGGAFLLESVEGGERMGRYSFIGVLPRATLVFRDGVASILDDGGVRAIDYTDPLTLLRSELARYKRTGGGDLPRFSGGAVGYVGYDAARRFERLPAASRDVLRLPEAAFSIYDTVVCFDHVRHSLLVIAHDVEDERENAASRIARVFAALDAPVSLPARGERVARTVTANGTADEYRARVAKARQLIADGDCIQIVLAQRFDVRPAPEPLALYRALRHVNPSPYMFLIDDLAGATLVGASPEPFVRVEDGRVVMHPIAGTRPRGRDEREDAENERERRGS